MLTFSIYSVVDLSIDSISTETMNSVARASRTAVAHIIVFHSVGLYFYLEVKTKEKTNKIQ